ncbi:hypothetical protein TELCIR_14135 [Teladorsagia circumcincta]|uniref:Uncharacterized protein n=1 Tax=Teladorsagia circumcincta TaxID=45464 RepID=A0A2G9U3H4_TELCI|nr:hypothetical protein TELCIR_14135 [Teladorsagia circumcincta]
MSRLVVLLSIVALSLACKPTTKAGGGAGSGGDSSKKAKREVQEEEVIVVTHQNYDPELSDSYMGVVRSAVEQHAQEEGVMTDHDLVEEKPGNVGGKFAVTYAVVDAECDQLKNFIMRAKEGSAIINYVTVTCDGEETVL